MACTLVFDIACELHVYLLKRFPFEISSIKFRVDAFHGKGHVSCQPGEMLHVVRSTRQVSEDLQFNSSAAENSNSSTRRLANMVATSSHLAGTTLIAQFVKMRNENFTLQY